MIVLWLGLLAGAARAEGGAVRVESGAPEHRRARASQRRSRAPLSGAEARRGAELVRGAEQRRGAPLSGGAALFRAAVCELGGHFECVNSTDLMRVNDTGAPEDCARVCVSLPDCTHFSWQREAGINGEHACVAKRSPSSGIRRAADLSSEGALTGTCRSHASAGHVEADHGCSMEHDVDYDDGFFAELESADSADQCAEVCSSIEGCTHFSWIGFPDAGAEWYHKCYLKSGSPKRQKRKVGIVSGRCGRRPQHKSASPSPSWASENEPALRAGGTAAGGCSVEPGVDYGDGYLAVFRDVQESEACALVCSEVPGCTHFSWVDPAREESDDLRSCYLKSGAPRKRRTVSKVVSGICRQVGEVQVSDVADDVAARRDTGCSFEPGTDFFDAWVAELRSVSSAEDCGAACVLLDDCTHFTWVGNHHAGGKWRRNCYLKAGTPTGRQANAIVTSGLCRRGHASSRVSGHFPARRPESNRFGKSEAAGYHHDAAIDDGSARAPAPPKKAALRIPVRILHDEDDLSDQGAMAEVVSEEIVAIRKHSFDLTLLIVGGIFLVTVLSLVVWWTQKQAGETKQKGYAPVAPQELLFGPSVAELEREAMAMR